MDNVFSVNNLGCAHCGAKIEEAINKLEGIESAVLNFPLKKLTVKGDVSPDTLKAMNETAQGIEAGVEIVPVKKEKSVVLNVKDLGCAHCGAKIEEAVSKMPGVDSAVLNFPLRRLTVKGDITDELISQINAAAGNIEAGVTVVPASKAKKSASHEHHHEEHEHHHDHCCDGSHEHDHDHEHCCHHDEDHEHCCDHEHEHEHEHHHEEHEHHHGDSHSEERELSFDDISVDEEFSFSAAADETDDEAGEENEKSLRSELIPLGAGVLLFIIALILSRTSLPGVLSFIFYAAAYLTLGYNVLISTFMNIMKKNFFDENFLMTVATMGAFALGEYPEAVGVVLFFRIGEIFEDYAVSKSRKAITAAAALKVDEADVWDGEEFVRVPADDICEGDLLRIKNGERIAADGIIETGSSKIDTSAVNGEPVPVVVAPGDSVMSGCINMADTFTVRATAAADDSMIAKIARAVEDASAGKPEIDRFITRFAKIYTPIVIAIALLTAIIPSIITGDWSKWIYSALTFLVISCPCALVLSVPLAYFSGIGAASKLGILFKSGASIEALGKVKTIAFDKTGTLTDGTFNVTSITSYGKLNNKQLLLLCGSCEQVSTHPVAESIIRCCKEAGISLTEPDRSSELPGRGITAFFGRKSIICGNDRLMNEYGIALPENEKPASGSIVYVAVNRKVEGRIVISDSPKKTAREAVASLNSMGILTALLSGDKKENAAVAGKELGIGYILGGLMPEDKLDAIKLLREENGAVMFVGDGINDGPVLAGADIGGAMQSGSDLALEAADAVFMNSEPVSVLRAKRIADRTLKISYANIIFALAVKALVLILGLAGHPNMWLAVFADSGTAMLLILNSVRILDTKKYI
ncbi:MAG: cadmium-translocating P-type ATPase [Ruminococcus sp.]|nr:cadmium-translocating P-type ATPase [Ruminococcus sp.]